MKRIFISGLAILLATAAVQAQTDTTKTPQHRHQKLQNGEAYKQLNLSADQQAKMKELNADMKQKREALKTQKLTEAERKTAIQALHQQHKTATNAILTPAQNEQLTKMKANRKAHLSDRKKMDGDSNSRQSRAKGAGLQKELALTTEQQAKVKEIRSGFKKEAETVRNDQALTQEQKREKLRELMQQQQEQLKTVLTKEQQEKWESLRKERAARNTR